MTAATAGVARSGALGGRQRVVDQLADPRQLVERGLGLEPPDRAPGMADERLARGVQDRGEPLEPARGRGQPVGQRGEFAGLQREQAVADEIDPFERVPGVLAQLGLGEAGGLELADEQVAVDRLVGRQTGHRSELGEPAIAERQSLGPAGGGQVRPAVVVRVLTGRGREGRIEPEELGQEGVRCGWGSRTSG